MAKTRLVIVPREGTKHPAFADLNPKDAVELFLRFERRISAPRAQKALMARVHGWIESTDWSAAGGQAAFAPIELGPEFEICCTLPRAIQSPLR